MNHSSPELSNGLTVNHKHVLLHQLHVTADYDAFYSLAPFLDPLGKQHLLVFFSWESTDKPPLKPGFRVQIHSLQLLRFALTNKTGERGENKKKTHTHTPPTHTKRKHLQIFSCNIFPSPVWIKNFFTEKQVKVRSTQRKTHHNSPNNKIFPFCICVYIRPLNLNFCLQLCWIFVTSIGWWKSMPEKR